MCDEVSDIRYGRGQARYPRHSLRSWGTLSYNSPQTQHSRLKPLLRKPGVCEVAMGRYWQCRDIVTVRWHDPCPSCYVTRMIAAHSPVWNIGVVSSGVGCSRNY